MKSAPSDLRASARFDGFPAEAFEFFEQLAKHNERPWLREHKDCYERACRERIVDALRAKGNDVDTHEKLKSAPRGYASDHPRIELLRMKDLYGGKTFPREPWLSTRKALRRIQKTIDDISPLADWVHAYVDPRR